MATRGKAPVKIVVGDRTILDPVGLLRDLRSDKALGYTGYLYYDHQPATSGDSLVIEDLGVTVLLNSRAGWRAGKSLVERAGTLDLTSIENVPLEDATPPD